MARVKEYIDTDVYTEAKNRIRHCVDVFDTLVVAFSGGKDSLAVLHLMKEVYDELGLGKVNVIFRDEELIPQEVIDFVDEYRRKDWINMLWFCNQMLSDKYILGVSKKYIQWDNDREWIRPKPEWAITTSDEVYDQYTMDAVVASYFKGSVGIVNGVRSSESLIRFRSVVNKLNENYINTPVKYGDIAAPKNVKMVKPIYDWEENDVFKYFYEAGIRYCPIYDSQIFAGSGLRVSTPLHAESAKKFALIREISPDFYDKLIQLFPEMQVQERYYSEYDRKSIVAKYGKSLETVRDWIEDNLEGAQYELAVRRYDSVIKRARRFPKSYPPDYILKTFMSGAYKRQIIPQASK